MLGMPEKFKSNVAPKWRLLRFVLVGGWNAFLSLALFYVLVFSLGNSWYQKALLITFIASTLNSYFMQKFFVWQRVDSSLVEFGHFFIVCAFQYFMNALILFFLVKYLNYSPKVIQLPLSFLIAILSYFYFKTRVFRIKIDEISQ